MLEVIEHLDDPAALLAEARRVARRNVLLSTPNSHPELRHRAAWSSATCSTSTTAGLHGGLAAELLDGVFGASHVEQSRAGRRARWPR